MVVGHCQAGVAEVPHDVERAGAQLQVLRGEGVTESMAETANKRKRGVRSLVSSDHTSSRERETGLEPATACLEGMCCG